MTVFICIMVVGFVVLGASLLFGEIFEHGGDIAHDIAVEHDVLGQGGDVEHSQGGPSFLSLRMLASFATGFGGGGAIGRYLDFGYVASSLFGLALAVAVAAVVYFIVAFLYKQQATSGVTTSECLNKQAIVCVAIPDNGMGQVTLTLKGATLTKMAKSEDGKSRENGATVLIKQIVGDYIIVG
ncbi:MAG: hypothetical protein NTW66_00230 [Candidatus Magasanikbacteria bacterium]|nr:hypothetical protein [Candidatus Magasanikbacteria bacterium]